MAVEIRRKVIGVPLQKAAKAEDGSYLVRGKFTSDQRDEVGDIITRAATERALPKYRQWGNIRMMHQPMPVGLVRSIGVQDGLDWNEVEIDVIDPQAQFMVERGLLKALSVGILIDPSKIDVLADGGWVINDYQLAEISLVDHPANYDAALETLSLSIDEGLRNSIREQGVVSVMRTIGLFPAQKGEPMEPNTEVPEVEPVTEAEPVVEASKTVEAETPAEQPVEEPVVEEPVAEVVAEAAVPSALAQLFSALAGAIQSLSDKVDSLAVKQEPPAPQADVEVPQDKGISGEAERVAQLEKQLADLTAKFEALSTPVDRKGALPVEEPVAEEPVAEEPVIEQKLSLRDAVKKHFESRAH